MDDEIFGGGDNTEEQPRTYEEADEVDVTEPAMDAAEPETEVNQEAAEAEQTQQNVNYTQQNYNQQPYGQYQGNMNGQYQYNNGAPQNQYGYNQYNGNQYNPYNQSGQYSAPAQNPKKKNSGMKVFIAIIAVIVVLAVALMIAIFAGGKTSDIISNPEAVTSTESGNSSDRVVADNVGDLSVSSASLEAGEAAVVAEIAQRYNVGILIYQRNALYTEGSGVVVKEDNDGKYTYIVTCAHVVNHDGVAVSVLMADGTEYTADVVGLDTRTDIAVVRIEATGLV